MRKRLLVATSIITVFLILVVFTSVYYIVPNTLGDRFVSFSVRLEYVDAPLKPSMDIVYFNGSIVPVTHIGLIVNITNGYFLPVKIRQNDFPFVILVYNKTVADPADVAKNKNSLIWGAFYSKKHYPAEFDDAGYWLGSSGYNYYLTNKKYFNTTYTIPSGTRTHRLFIYSISAPVWGGKNWLTHDRALPGKYYVYCIIYGKVSLPMSVTIISLR